MSQIVIATPVRSGQYRTGMVSVGYMEFVQAMVARGAGFLGGAVTYGADTCRGRNRIAAKVLREAPDAKYVLWCDDDQWPDEIGIVDRMIALNEDVVGAAYTNKAKPLRMVYQNDTIPKPVDERGVTYVRGVGFGFTLTSTRSLRILSASCRSYTDDDGAVVSNIFGLEYANRPDRTTVLQSEDYSFCQHWRDAGGAVALYAGGLVYHAGSYAWSAKDMADGIVDR